MTESTQQTDPRMTSSIVYQVPYMSEVCTDIPYGKNTSIDLFLEEALRCNAPVSLINYPGGKHQNFLCPRKFWWVWNKRVIQFEDVPNHISLTN